MPVRFRQHPVIIFQLFEELVQLAAQLGRYLLFRLRPCHVEHGRRGLCYTLHRTGHFAHERIEEWARLLQVLRVYDNLDHLHQRQAWTAENGRQTAAKAARQKQVGCLPNHGRDFVRRKCQLLGKLHTRVHKLHRLMVHLWDHAREGELFREGLRFQLLRMEWEPLQYRIVLFLIVRFQRQKVALVQYEAEFVYPALQQNLVVVITHLEQQIPQLRHGVAIVFERGNAQHDQVFDAQQHIRIGAGGRGHAEHVDCTRQRRGPKIVEVRLRHDIAPRVHNVILHHKEANDGVDVRFVRFQIAVHRLGFL
uniref:Uncharacterized protein n=1 Tax=Anopheles christyi TaxID=43041 RepID=A0A182KIF7_9DIPT